MSNNNIQLFQNETFGQVRVIMKDGEPWFVARDVAKALGYVDPADAVQRHCKKVNKISHQGAAPNRPPLNILIIPEFDVYRLIMHSQLPSAEKFQDWICEEVIPSIRKTGQYNSTQSTNKEGSFNVETINIAENILSKVGIVGNQLVLALDKIYKKHMSYSLLEVTGIQLVAPTQRQLLTPTAIGKHFVREDGKPYTAKQTNELLATHGLQISVAGNWEPTEKGRRYEPVMLDTGKAHNTGIPVRQLKWSSDILDFCSQFWTKLAA